MLVSSETKEKKGIKKLNSIAIAIAFHLILGLIFALVVILPGILEKPEIIAEVAAPGPRVDQQMQKRNVTKQVSKSSSASAASPIAKLMRANAAAVIAAPEVKKVSDGPIGLGEGEFGEGGLGSGGGGFGSGASFFGSRSSGNRIAFVLDYSLSMKSSQREMLHREMEKTLKALDPRIKYQIIMFSGPVWFAGWDPGKSRSSVVTRPDGKKFTYDAKGGAERYKSVGTIPTDKWLSATKANITKSVRDVRASEYTFGTVWLNALEVAHKMDPPPDTIFFMADGTGGNTPGPILTLNNKNGKPKINTFAMQTKSGAKEFQEIAKKTGGDFRIILGANKTISGDEFFKDPSKFNISGK